MGSIIPRLNSSAISATHPKCPVCAVPMWLVLVTKHVSGDPQLTRNQYECKACDAVAILPPMDD